MVPPWYSSDNDPELVQAVAETDRIRRDRDVPEIIKIVRRAVLPSLLGYPAYPPNNFFDEFADDYGPETYLDWLSDYYRAVGPPPSVSEDPERLTWRLPGMGESKKKCGRFMRSLTYGCPEGHEVHGVRHTCHNLSCPVCFPDAVRRMAGRTSDVLRRVHELNGGVLVMRHVVVSPPQEWASSKSETRGGFKDLKGEVWGVLRGCGVSGCALLFHPYRQNDGSDTWRVGPHFHAVTLSANGFVNPKSVPPGWIVKVVGGPVYDLAPLIYYLASHVGVSEGVRNAVSYFGCCSTAGRLAPVRVGEWSEDVHVECRACQGPEYRYYDFMSVRVLRWTDTAPPVSERRVWRAWCLRRDRDAVRVLLDGLDLGGVLALGDPRIYVQCPAAYDPDPSEVDAVSRGAI